MKKLQFFIFVESILLTFALVTILSGHFSRVILFLVLFLLLLYYYFGKQRGNFLLVTALLFAVIYGMIVAYPYIYKENGVTNLIFDDTVNPKREKNKWLGNLHHFGPLDTCRFDDINLFRLVGKDTIHLEQVIITNHDNVIILRKFFGNTKIIVPVDVAVSLKVNNLYGELQFLGQPVYELRNESLSLTTPDFKRAHKSVKIVLSTFVGNVEVVRK